MACTRAGGLSKWDALSYGRGHDIREKRLSRSLALVGAGLVSKFDGRTRHARRRLLSGRKYANEDEGLAELSPACPRAHEPSQKRSHPASSAQATHCIQIDDDAAH